MRRFAILLSCLLLVVLLTACGEVEIPTEDDTGERILITPTDETAADEADETGDATDEDSEDDAADSTAEDDLTTVRSLAELESACQEENEQLSEALELNTEALATCETERKSLAARLQENASGTSGSEDRYRGFVSFYLENAPLAEYPFPKCGPLNTFTGESWYASFTAALDAARIPFGNKTVEASELTGGCASAEGQMAFFLGAESEVLSEFHLLKYDFTTNQVEEAFLVDGTCTVCPSQLGSRSGNYLTLSGQGGGTTVEYEYYYDANILKQR